MRSTSPWLTGRDAELSHAEWVSQRSREYQEMYDRENPLGDAHWTLASRRMNRRRWVNVQVQGDVL